MSKDKHLLLHFNMASPNSVGKHCNYFMASMAFFKERVLRRENRVHCTDTSLYGRINNFIYSLANMDAKLACCI